MQPPVATVGLASRKVPVAQGVDVNHPTAQLRRTRRGFTLVELLVVVALIGAMMVLLLPAVQAARESARRVNCTANLKQIGLAVHNYLSSQGALPPSGAVEKNPRYNTWDPLVGKMFSWTVFVLPYLEQQTLYDRFDLHKTALEQAAEPQAVQLPVLLCPSDGAEGEFFQHPTYTNNKRFAKSNYAAYVSPFHIDLQHLAAGALVWHREQREVHIQDGLTNTLLGSEVRVRPNPLDQRGAWALAWTGASLLAFDMHPRGSGRMVYRCDPLSFGNTQPPNNQGPNIDILYDCPDVADAQLAGMPCGTYKTAKSSLGYLSAAPRSQHPGGVNAVYLDGRVEFLVNAIDEATMAYKVSIDDLNPPDSQGDLTGDHSGDEP